MTLDILVVDDEADIRALVSDILKDEGYAPRAAKNSVETFEAIAEKIPAALVLDIWLKDSELDGLGILEVVKRRYPQLPVIVISGHGTIETAINSLRMGAYDYIEKPFKQDRLTHTLARALEDARLRRENHEMRLYTGLPDLFVGTSAYINQMRQMIDKVAPTGSRVFITGPAGTGKEVIARTIHAKSRRRFGPFVTLSVAGLSPEAVEQELFGTEESSDLNAPARKVGALERANNATLYLDEVLDIPHSTQGKLVRFLQEKSFERLGGGGKRIESDVRVIAASKKNIQEEIRAGRLREDLYYRLAVVPLKAPALKERREDIPPLAEHFLLLAAKAAKIQPRKLSEDAVAAMQAYEWPGNVRQLRNVVEWLLIMCPENEGAAVTSEMLPREIFSSGPATMTPEANTDIMSMQLREAREMFERQYLLAQINRFGGNISRTASFIGMERSALHRKLKSLLAEAPPEPAREHAEEREEVTA